MTDNIRQAAVDCAKEVAEADLRYFTMEFKELSRADIIERAMRKLVPSEPNPYAIAMEKHLCEHDMADWLACAGHGDNFCAVCNNEKEHFHRSVLPIIRAYVAERVKEAVEAEREVCAESVEGYFKREQERYMPNGAYVSGEVCAAEIRARGMEAKR